MSITPDQLRSDYRKRRALLDERVLQDNARDLHHRVADEQVYQSAQHVAAYIAIKGEIDVRPIIDSGASAGKQFYLPVLRGEQMFFAPWSPGQALQKRGFGLLEPEVPEQQWCEPAALDLVLTPLVVFDASCNRIGQGGGYYDKTFAFRQGTSRRPFLMGVAHDCQRYDHLSAQEWDVPLDAVITECTRYGDSADH